MTERNSIVAFIDVLGFEEVMLSDDKERREKAIQLLKRVSSYGASHGVRTESLGIGEQIIMNAEVTTFSDNVVLSIPICDVKYNGLGGETIKSASSFLTQLITLLISIYWQGLHLGMLFRGAITTGRLYHDGDVVAGEGLVKAVSMEKETRWPRIEIDAAILNKKDDRGEALLEQRVREIAIVEENVHYFLNTLGFHIGVWRDYNHFSGKTESSWEEVKQALDRIREQTQSCIDKLERLKKSRTGEASSKTEEAQNKWIWFRDAFEAAQSGEDWQRIWSTQKSEG